MKFLFVMIRFDAYELKYTSA